MQQQGANAIRPLSRSYKALDLSATNTLVESEEKLSLKAYEKDSAEKALT